MELKKLFVFVSVFCMHVSCANTQEFIITKRLDSISMFFKFGSAEVISPQRLIARFNRINASSGKIKIVAYTDTIGNLTYNKKLANIRINAIKEIIESNKLNSFAIESENLNEYRVVPSKRQDSLYRRCDVVIYQIENKFEYNTPINLEINFESKTTNITPNSSENLAKLLLILQQDSLINIQLNGHVCCTPAYQLSLDRATKVKTYLVSNGIKSNRIQCKGFSNSKPLVSESIPENKEKNMRVEVIFRK